MNASDSPQAPAIVAGIDVSKGKLDLHLWPIGTARSYNRIIKAFARHSRGQAVQGRDDRLHAETADDAQHDGPRIKTLESGTRPMPKQSRKTTPKNHSKLLDFKHSRGSWWSGANTLVPGSREDQNKTEDKRDK